MQRTYAKVTFRREGWHRWPDAPPERAYLAYPHRHLFHVTVLVEVQHNDREIEFHDLLDTATGSWLTMGYTPSQHEPESSEWSCERMAANVVGNVTLAYPGRYLRIEVMEDGENGAIIEHFPTITPEPAQ